MCQGSGSDEEKNGYVARDQLLYALYCSYMLDSCKEFGHPRLWAHAAGGQFG